MSEDVRIAREFAEKLFPGLEMSDEEVVRLAYTDARAYRAGVKSERDRALRRAARLTGELIETEIEENRIEGDE